MRVKPTLLTSGRSRAYNRDMRLADYLERRNIPRSQFARNIKVADSYVTHLCQGKAWPSRKIVGRIIKATDGKVTANDFLKRR